jgi:hypothetical protein
MPGYLPEDEVDHYESWDDAIDGLIWDMGRLADAIVTWADEHDCDDIPCPTYGDDCPWDMAKTCEALASELDALKGADTTVTEWYGYVGGYGYWITPCEESECSNV